jgi:hypothetical protein
MPDSPTSLCGCVAHLTTDHRGGTLRREDAVTRAGFTRSGSLARRHGARPSFKQKWRLIEAEGVIDIDGL